MAGQRRPDTRAVAMHHVVDTRRHTGRVNDLGEDLRREGAASDGLRTMVQPAANAGYTLQAIWLSGQFQV